MFEKSDQLLNLKKKNDSRFKIRTSGETAIKSDETEPKILAVDGRWSDLKFKTLQFFQGGRNAKEK